MQTRLSALLAGTLVLGVTTVANGTDTPVIILTDTQMDEMTAGHLYWGPPELHFGWYRDDNLNASRRGFHRGCGSPCPWLNLQHPLGTERAIPPGPPPPGQIGG
jgi:hypothetical protein